MLPKVSAAVKGGRRLHTSGNNTAPTRWWRWCDSYVQEASLAISPLRWSSKARSSQWFGGSSLSRVPPRTCHAGPR